GEATPDGWADGACVGPHEAIDRVVCECRLQLVAAANGVAELDARAVQGTAGDRLLQIGGCQRAEAVDTGGLPGWGDGHGGDIARDAFDGHGNRCLASGDSGGDNEVDLIEA